MIDVVQDGAVYAIRMSRSWFGRPFYWTTAYWLDGLLIDTGPACTARQLAKLLARLPVRQIAITHAHEDHIGGLYLLRRQFPDAKVYASRQAIPLIENPQRIEMQWYRRLLWGEPQPVQGVESLDSVEDRLITDDYVLRAIETPGHSRDHTSYFEPRYRWLFSGDAFIGGRDVAWTPEFDLFGVISSLRTLASLRPERLFAGSGTVRRTPLPDLHGKISALAQLAQEVGRLDGDGCTTAEIVDLLFEGEPRIKVWSMGHFSAANLVEACRSYNAIVAPPAADAAPPEARRMCGSARNFNDFSCRRSFGSGDVRR